MEEKLPLKLENMKNNFDNNLRLLNEKFSDLESVVELNGNN